MPDLGATDPADLKAKARAELVFSRQIEQPRQVAPQPFLGGTGYPVWYREQQLEKWNVGEVTDVSESSLFRWSGRLEPYRQTGNRERSRIIGTELLNLVTYITAWPDATLDKMAAFIFDEGGGLYSRQAISQQLAELDRTKKVLSTEGYQTQHPDVQFCVWGFWNCHPPLGVFQVPRRKLLDVDKFGLTFEKCNRTSGWAVTVHRVRKDGHYHHGMKMTIIFAIEPGDPALPAHVPGSVERP
jgi:hypothetical protein